MLDGGVRLRFQGQAGRSYTIRVRATLGEEAWQILRTFPTQAAPTILEVTDPGSEAARFYRVSTP